MPLSQREVQYLFNKKEDYKFCSSCGCFFLTNEGMRCLCKTLDDLREEVGDCEVEIDDLRDALAEYRDSIDELEDSLTDAREMIEEQGRTIDGLTREISDMSEEAF